MILLKVFCCIVCDLISGLIVKTSKNENGGREVSCLGESLLHNNTSTAFDRDTGTWTGRGGKLGGWKTAQD